MWEDVAAKKILLEDLAGKKGTDTVASTYTQIGNGMYWIRDIGAGTYNFSYVPNDTIHKTAFRTVVVNLGQTTMVDSVKLEKK